MNLILGTMTFGDTATPEAAREMVEIALARGITTFDTANGYAGTRSEVLLGEILRGRRDEVSIATKVGIYPGDSDGHPLLSAPAIHASVRASLRRLGTDRVDLLYLHQPDRSVPLDETATALADLVKDGLVGAVGVSNYAAWQITDVAAACRAAGAPAPVIAQQLYNLVARRIEAEYTEYALTHGLTTVVYNPLGGGLLTGRHTLDTPPTDGRFGSSPLAAMYRERYWNRPLFDAVDALGRIAADAGLALPALALRWLLARDVVGAVLLGGSKPAQLTANLDAAADGPLPADLVAACDEAGATLSGPMPAYNR
ncbi:aldo/keto reductase [Catenuloplanes japonicus]|uniref:aldo/keto reductase n=1 Tax=Catenuloplanes japonicus TaxID=33876 RepID=UPI00068D282E|nr:aldo/keto reductase [Catenuloplanes japonicus]